MNLEILGQRIKEARTNAGKTQQQVAEEIGTTKSVISNYERGKRHISTKILTEIAKYLNCELEILLKPKP